MSFAAKAAGQLAVLTNLAIKSGGQKVPTISSPLLSSLRAAALLTAVACILVTVRQFIENNIDCLPNTSFDMDDEDFINALETYCYVAPTYTLPNVTDRTAPHPGLSSVPGLEETEAVYHNYYLWVPFLLAAQSVLLYLPVLLWRSREGGYLNALLAGAHNLHLHAEDDRASSRRSAEVFSRTVRQCNGGYYLSFRVCELVGVAIAVGNLFITNTFLGGQFFMYSPRAIQYLVSNAVDPHNPMNQVFPKVAMCTLRNFGPTGSLQVIHALCVLPLNVVNEKTYLVLWIAFYCLSAVVVLVAIYHLVLFAGFLDRRIVKSAGEQKLVKEVLKHCSQADKFILWNLQGYIVDFNGWIADVLQQLEAKED